MQNKLTLLNLDISQELANYSDIIGTELNWLFKGSIPQEVLFIPDAFEGSDLNLYIQKVRAVFAALQVNLKVINEGDPVLLINSASCIVVGGGNLGKLLRAVDKYKQHLNAAIAGKIPFIGWNEGAVLACPAYVEPDVITGFPACLGATKHQFYVHFLETETSRNKMKTFFNRHQSSVPAIQEVYCLTDRPDGTGVRLEDDNTAIDFAGNSPVDPRRKFTLKDLV